MKLRKLTAMAETLVGQDDLEFPAGSRFFVVRPPPPPVDLFFLLDPPQLVVLMKGRDLIAEIWPRISAMIGPTGTEAVKLRMPFMGHVVRVTAYWHSITFHTHTARLVLESPELVEDHIGAANATPKPRRTAQRKARR